MKDLKFHLLDPLPYSQMKTKIRSEMAEPDGTADEYARAKRLAKRFDVCIRSIRRWGDKGHYAKYKLSPRVVVYKEAEVKAYVDQSRVG
jgi:hypothetical protein